MDTRSGRAPGTWRTRGHPWARATGRHCAVRRCFGTEHTTAVKDWEQHPPAMMEVVSTVLAADAAAAAVHKTTPACGMQVSSNNRVSTPRFGISYRPIYDRYWPTQQQCKFSLNQFLEETMVSSRNSPCIWSLKSITRERLSHDTILDSIQLWHTEMRPYCCSSSRLCLFLLRRSCSWPPGGMALHDMAFSSPKWPTRSMCRVGR